MGEVDVCLVDLHVCNRQFGRSPLSKGSCMGSSHGHAEKPG
jgi:hypothetical protein